MNVGVNEYDVCTVYICIEKNAKIKNYKKKTSVIDGRRTSFLSKKKKKKEREKRDMSQTIVFKACSND
jgi:hypothetical protein